MSATPETLAARLLDAQVAWAIDEITGERLPQVLERDVDELLGIAANHTVADVVDIDAVKQSARLIAGLIADSELLGELVVEFAGTIHTLPAAENYTLGQVLERDHVEALVAKILSMHTLHDRLLDRLTESPLVGTVASKFVTKIVADFVQQNRERAEKVPGMGSLLSLGSGAVSRVRNVTDKHVDALLGDAAGKGAQYAIRRTNAAIHELIRDAPIQGAVLEVWDLHADEPVSELREYLTEQDVRDLATLIFDLVADGAGSELVGDAVDACVDAFFDRCGAMDVAALVDALGLSRDDLLALAVRHAAPLLEALHGSGELDTLIRSRLAPFFDSPATLAVLAGEEPAAGSKPAKKKPAATKSAPAKQTAPAKKSAAAKKRPAPGKK